jgi:hypothetical protein
MPLKCFSAKNYEWKEIIAGGPRLSLDKRALVSRCWAVKVNECALLRGGWH